MHRSQLAQPPVSGNNRERRVATTVKLDQARHRQLKHLGIEEGRSGQQILVDALDAYLQARECKSSGRSRS